MIEFMKQNRDGDNDEHTNIRNI